MKNHYIVINNSNKVIDIIGNLNTSIGLDKNININKNVNVTIHGNKNIIIPLDLILSIGKNKEQNIYKFNTQKTKESTNKYYHDNLTQLTSDDKNKIYQVITIYLLIILQMKLIEQIKKL